MFLTKGIITPFKKEKSRLLNQLSKRIIKECNLTLTRISRHYTAKAVV